jgi:hypothetical protein
MIEILIGDVSLDLLSPSVRLEKSFGLETDVDFQKDYSFPMSLAQSAKNQIALGYTSLEQTDIRQKKFDCVLKILGIDYAAAKLNIIGFNPKEIRVTLSWGVAALPIMEKSLRDIDFGADEYLTGSSLANAVEAYFDPYYSNKMCFPPIYAPHWYGENNTNNTDFVGIVNYFNTGTQHYQVNDITYPHKYSFAPAFYVFWILKKIFENAGYTLNGNAFNDAELRTLVMYQNRALDKLQELYHAYVSTKNRKYLACTAGVDSYINIEATNTAYPDVDDTACWSNGVYGYQIASAGDYVVQIVLDYDSDSGVFYSGGSISPVLEVRLFLDATQIGAQTLNAIDAVTTFSFAHTASSGDVGKKYYVKIFSNGVGQCNGWINKGTTIDVSAVGGATVNVGNRYIKFSNYMPDWTCGELVSAFKNWAKVKFEIDDYRKVINMNLVEKVLNEKPINVTEKVTTEVDYKLQEFTGAAISYDFGSTDKFVDGGIKSLPTQEFLGFYNSPASVPPAQRPGQFIVMVPTNEVWVSADNLFWDSVGSLYDTYKVGDGSTEIKMRFAPIFMGIFNMAGVDTILPKIGDACSSSMYEMGDNDFTPRFAFYRGISVGYNTDGQYPFATTGIGDILGNISGSYSFDFYSANSLFQKLNINFYNLLLKGEEVEFDFLPDAQSILEFESWHKVMNNYLEFVSKQITITFDKGKIRGRVTALRK